MGRKLRRAYAICRDNGVRELLSATKKYVQYGSFTDDLLQLAPATKRLLRTRIRVGRYYAPQRFTDADPFKLLWIDPDEIVYDVSNTDVPATFGRVYGGSWDQAPTPIVDTPIYEAMRAHFVEGVPWEETAYYNRKKSKLEAGKSTRGCTTVDDLPEYFNRFDELYESLQTDGYKLQRVLAREAPSKTTRQNLDAPTPELNEIGVCIGRNGSFLRRFRGRHRLAIAKLAGVDEVAVQVLVRHSEWQQVRNRVRENNGSSTASDSDEWDLDYEVHPDLIDLQDTKGGEY